MSSLSIVMLLMIGGPIAGNYDHIATEKAETMVASHYGCGDGFDGRRMANGEIFRADDPTVVAHKYLPFGTKLWLTNPDTGISQKAVVKDRGPFLKDKAGNYTRDLDVSAAAAKRLGFLEKGVTRLKVTVLP